MGEDCPPSLKILVKKRLTEKLREIGVENPRFFSYFVEDVCVNVKKELDKHEYASEKLVERLIEKKASSVLEFYKLVYGWKQ
ncbi:MAG: hypothetical protein QXK07_06250 [Desulfurococcaceae archaeon]